MFPAFPCKNRIVGGAVHSSLVSVAQLSDGTVVLAAVSAGAVLQLREFVDVVTRNI